jgi:lysozyme family protein
MTKIRYIEGIPPWFSRLVHILESNLKCRRVGHDGDHICAHCGQFMGELAQMDDPNFYMDEQWRTVRRWAKEQQRP